MKTLKFRFLFSWFFIALGLVFPAKPMAGEFVAQMPQVIYPFFLTIADGRIYIVESDAYLLSFFFRYITKEMKRIARFVELSFLKVVSSRGRNIYLHL